MIENQAHIKFLFVCILFFLIAERLENTFRSGYKRQKNDGSRIFQRGLFYILLSVYLLIVSIGVYSFFEKSFLSINLLVIGVTIFTVGVGVRRAALAALGEMWSVFIEVKKNQVLIKKGIYKYLKHPYYTAVILELVGFSLACHSLPGILLAILVQGSLIIYRIKIEERVLDVFGRRKGF